MNPKELNRFVEKYRLAEELALKSDFDGGINGLEIEWNVTNAAFRPLHHVGAGPDARSFVETLRERFVPESQPSIPSTKTIADNLVSLCNIHLSRITAAGS